MDNISLTRKNGTQRDYNPGFKLSVVEQVNKGELAYKQAQRTYGIQGRSKVFTLLLDMVCLITFINTSYWSVRRKSIRKQPAAPNWIREYLDLLARCELPPEQVSVSDITYVETNEGVRRLYLFTDAFSRKIVDHNLIHEMKAFDTVAALN